MLRSAAATPVSALLLLLAGCGRSAAPSGATLQSLFDAPEISLLGADRVLSGPAAAMGALEAVVADPAGGPRAAYSLCTGIQIAPHFVLTAGHCAKYEFVFNPYRLATDLASSQLSYETFGSVVRLNYSGGIDGRSAPLESTGASVTTPAYLNTAQDFAVFELPAGAAQAATSIDLSTAVDSATAALPQASSLVLYGYPNGVPLASAACHTLALGTSPWLVHDCDALGGSSGGLIADSATGAPVALHLAGPVDNDAQYYLNNGKFESAADFATRRGCPAVSGDQPDSACIKARGYNRAIALAVVYQTLASAAPQLSARISEDRRLRPASPSGSPALLP